ncbi:hypothetical protein Pint_05898 [Pistacia integerrima]|uniref:Uncharacterized protein n=1 Tax=Pistacia integerrima TaxID=434235 RepID=A0ACC0Z2N2_9ROSI|nr:hypothetical protein Pint_05898 [Pistacia integerrima]
MAMVAPLVEESFMNKTFSAMMFGLLQFGFVYKMGLFRGHMAVEETASICNGDHHRAQLSFNQALSSTEEDKHVLDGKNSNL